MISKLTTVITMFLLCSNACYGQDEDAATAAEQKIKKQFIEDCLSTSDDKYELYRNCIGKFANACTENSQVYADVMTDIGMGGVVPDCFEREEIWWHELFKQYADQLLQKVNLQNDKEITETLETTIKTLDQRSVYECAYVSVRWGKSDVSPVRENVYDQFKCINSSNAEAAIMLYLWNKQLKILKD